MTDHHSERGGKVDKRSRGENPRSDLNNLKEGDSFFEREGK